MSLLVVVLGFNNNKVSKLFFNNFFSLGIISIFVTKF